MDSEDQNENQESNDLDDDSEEEQEITEQEVQNSTKSFAEFCAKERPKTWLSPSVGAVIKMAVEDIVLNNKNIVPPSNLAHEIVSLKSKTNAKKIFPLRVAMREAAKKVYFEGWKGSIPSGDQLNHYNTCRDFYMRTFSDNVNYGPLRYKLWTEAITNLSSEWQNFFRDHIFPLLCIQERKESAHKITAAANSRKRIRDDGDGDLENVYKLRDAAERLEFRFHKGVHASMPVKLSDTVRPATAQDMARILDLGRLKRCEDGEKSHSHCTHPGRRVTIFDANDLITPQVQKDLVKLLEEKGVHNHNGRLAGKAAPNDKIGLDPIWSGSILKRGAMKEGNWTDVASEAEYGPNRLHATYDSLNSFSQQASEAEKQVIASVVSGSDNVYSCIHDAIIAGDPNMADVTNTLLKDEFSVLCSRCIREEDAINLQSGKYKFRKADKKFYKWTEPAAGIKVSHPPGQPVHMDMRHAAGGSIVIAVDRRQPFDIVLDSADGIEILYSDLLPKYDAAMAYYEKEVHEEWAKWNEGCSIECGKATFWSYIVDRHFKRRGVKRLWERITLMLEPGQGVFVSNRMLHAGAEYRGRAAYRIHMYMAEQGLLAAEVGEPQVSEIVYDYRTDPQLFVLARYLNAQPYSTIDMTQQE